MADLTKFYNKSSSSRFVEISSREEEEQGEKAFTSSEIREVCKMWETVHSFVEKHHLNKTVCLQALNLFDKYVMVNFHEIQKHKQQQVSFGYIPCKSCANGKDSHEPLKI